MRERSVYSSSLQHRLEAETTHEREERLQRRRLEAETTHEREERLQRRRLEAETTHEREERLQQLSDNQQRKLDTETTALHSRSPHNA